MYQEYLPKYIQIKEIIKSRIRDGHYKRGQKLKPRTELAREFRTTLSTCTKAVEELLFEKELESQVGVGTFISGQSIEQKLQIYGIVRTFNNPFYGKFADSLGRVLAENNFLTPKVISSQYSPEREAETVRAILNETNTKIVMCGFLSPETRRMILDNPDRFYIFGRAPELNGKANQIVTDAEAGAFQSMRYLMEMGHRDIAVISAIPSSDGKVKAYRQALGAAGITVKEDFIISVPGSDNMTAEKLGFEMNVVLDRILRYSRVPSAVLCISDFIAVTFISACQMRGLRVPEDFSVCGYDGAFEGLTGAMSLTTAIQPLDGLFGAVLKHISGGGAGGFINVSMPPVFKPGNTVRSLKERA